MRVYVVMGNDYPDAVFKTEEAAEVYCDGQRAEEKKHQPKPPRIYWRVYDFELGE